MVTETTILMGEVTENPSVKRSEIDLFLVGFLKSLIEEQNIGSPPSQPAEER